MFCITCNEVCTDYKNIENSILYTAHDFLIVQDWDPVILSFRV